VNQVWQKGGNHSTNMLIVPCALVWLNP
jgi:hypothetical protein